MTESNSDFSYINQLRNQSRWSDLIPTLKAALDNDSDDPGQDFLILCAAAIQLGRMSSARALLRQGFSAGVVSKREAASFLIDDVLQTLAKARDQFPSNGWGHAEASAFLADALPLSDLTRWYRPEGKPVVYISRQLTESQLAEVGSECIELVERLQACSDRSLGSAALRDGISDSDYAELFSAELTDVIRPFSTQINGLRVLVLDSQGGAQARFLAECGASVTAVAASPEHALLNAALCADLPHVQVVLDAPHLVPFRGLFDLVVIGGYQEAFLARS